MTESPAKGLPAVLREWAGEYEEGSFDTEAGLMTEAADALEAQERLIEALTAALEEIRDMPVMNAVTVYEIARAALDGKHRNPS